MLDHAKSWGPHIATCAGPSGLQSALIGGGNANATEEGSATSALMYACARGHKDKVEILLAYGASVYARDRFGSTCLSYAAREGTPAVIEILLEKGADKNSRDVDRLRPVAIAKLHENVEAVALLA